MLRDFKQVWALMSPENRGRLVRALVVKLRVDEERNTIEVELVGGAADLARTEAL